MLILGIDPGYAIVGYGLVEAESANCRAVEYGAVTTPAHSVFEARLKIVYDDISSILKRLRPQALSIETLFYSSNQKTVIFVAEARGVILLAANQAGVPVFEYTPLQVKQTIAGYGLATKKQVQEMTRMQLCLRTIPKPDDTADALAMAVTHARSCSSRLFGMTGNPNNYNPRPGHI